MQDLVLRPYHTNAMHRVRLKAMLLLLSAALASAAGDNDIAVCAVLENGFCMLANGVSANDTITSDTQLRGYDVEMRKYILSGRNYTVRLLGSYGELQVRTRAGECDIGWAQFFHTSARASCTSNCPALTPETESGTVESWEPYRCCAEFSFNMAPFDISILYVESGLTLFEAFDMATRSPFFINLVCFAFLLVVLFSHLIWLPEGNVNPKQFPPAYLDGINQAVWWGVVSFTTVGYGDKVPESGIGRCVAVIWIVLGITISSLLTGKLSDAFIKIRSKGSLTGAADLANLRTCGYSSTFSSFYVPTTISFTPVIGEHVNDCGKMMQQGLVDAILMEDPMMRYWASHDEWAATQTLGITNRLASVPMGILYPKGSAVRAELDFHFLQAYETSFHHQLMKTWFPQNTLPTQDATYQLELILPAVALIAAYFVLRCARRLLRAQISNGSVQGHAPAINLASPNDLARKAEVHVNPPAE